MDGAEPPEAERAQLGHRLQEDAALARTACSSSASMGSS